MQLQDNLEYPLHRIKFLGGNLISNKVVSSEQKITCKSSNEKCCVLIEIQYIYKMLYDATKFKLCKPQSITKN